MSIVHVIRQCSHLSPQIKELHSVTLIFALLKDIGYSISASPTGTNIGGTYTDPTYGGDLRYSREHDLQ